MTRPLDAGLEGTEDADVGVKPSTGVIAYIGPVAEERVTSEAEERVISGPSVEEVDDKFSGEGGGVDGVTGLGGGEETWDVDLVVEVDVTRPIVIYRCGVDRDLG